MAKRQGQRRRTALLLGICVLAGGCAQGTTTMTKPEAVRAVGQVALSLRDLGDAWRDSSSSTNLTDSAQCAPGLQRKNLLATSPRFAFVTGTPSGLDTIGGLTVAFRSAEDAGTTIAHAATSNFASCELNAARQSASSDINFELPVVKQLQGISADGGVSVVLPFTTVLRSAGSASEAAERIPGTFTVVLLRQQEVVSIVLELATGATVSEMSKGRVLHLLDDRLVHAVKQAR